MKDRLFISSTEFQQKVLDFISSGDLDKMIDNTVFKDEPGCKSAITYGMVIASLLTCRCKQYCIVEGGE